MAKNIFDNLTSPLETESNNPFNNLGGKNLSGVSMPSDGPSNFARIQTTREAAIKSAEEATKANSFTSLALQTLNPINLAKSAFKVAKSVVTNPIDTAREAALGFANGLTLGATDYAQRKAFVNEATKYGMDEKMAESLADSTLQPEDPTLSAIRGGADFASMVIPYAGVEKALIKGAAYAAPGFVTKYARAAKLLTDIGAFNVAGQINETFIPEDRRNRFQRAVIDTGTAGVFNAGGEIFRRIRGTKFQSPFEVQPVTNPNTLVPQGVVVSEQTLREGAGARIKELENKAFPRGQEPKELKFLKENIDNPDKLYEYNSNPPKADIPVPDAKTVATIKAGEVDPKTGEVKGPEIRVATNDLPALQDYIKGSGDINYKVVETLGRDSKGLEIQARHEFVNGVHTIYATNSTTASQLAHELGHYFDTNLTKTTEKLSSLITNFSKNREKIEDMLGSIAVERLGGNATNDQISKEIASMVKNIEVEIDTLSSLRRGKLIASKSERFADAVSQVTTESGAKEQAPILTQLLKQSERFKDKKLFGEGVIRDVAVTGDKAKDNVVTVLGKDFTMTGKAADGVKVATEEYKAKVKDSFGIETKAAKKEFVEKKIKVVKEGGPEVKVVEKAKKLDRSPTGKKPATEAFKADKISNDADVETFINTKFLSKVTGKERIGRSNEDIIKSAMSSKMTESDFNKILTERFGNMSGDIVKAKQILTDGALGLKNKLAGRDIADLTGQEMKDVMGDYSRLVETFEVFAGVRTELSNSFRSLGIGVNPGENDILASALESIQKALGNETNPFKLAQKAVALQEKGAVAKYFEIWYPSMLSGPKTTVRNLTGNASNLTFQTLSRLFTTQGRKEFFPMMESMINGHKEAFNKAAAVLKGEDTILSKIYEPTVPKEATFKGPLSFLNKVEYVGRFLNAQDAYFSSIAKDGEIAAQRVGDYTYGLASKEAAESINDAVGKAFSQSATFRNQFEKTFVGEIGSKFSSLKASDNAAVRTFGNFFVPFVKTIANITDRRIDFVPILNFARTFDSLGARKLFEQRAERVVKDASLFNKIFDDAIAKDMTSMEARGFAESEVARVKEIVIQRLKNQQMGKFYMGMTAVATGIPLAVAGRITGSGPSNKNERDTLMASGWRPNSIIMPNGVALPYQNLALPLASILSILGNVSDAYKYKDSESSTEKALSGLFGYMRSEMDQSFLTGISNLYDGLTGYTPPGQVISNLAANSVPIPAAWSQTKDIIFPERYVAKDFNSIIKNKLGITDDFFNTGLTTPLEPNLNAFGEQKKADLIYGLTPPLLNSKNDDPVLNFMLDTGINIGKPNMGNKIKGRRGEERVLTPEEYTSFVKDSGQKIYDELSRKVQNGYFDRYKTKEDKRKAVDSIVKAIRSREKDKINY
jgi:hypothetical protein